MGFGADVKSRQELDTLDWMRDVTPHDLVKFGLIPELVGRLPVITTLSGLDEDALIRILQEPKNAVLKQYVKLFDIDDVALEFTPDALHAVAKKTIERHTGARGLRSIMEEILNNLMYSVPSDPTVSKVTITKECVEGTSGPEMERDPERKPVSIRINTSSKKRTRNSAS